MQLQLEMRFEEEVRKQSENNVGTGPIVQPVDQCLMPRAQCPIAEISPGLYWYLHPNSHPNPLGTHQYFIPLSTLTLEQGWLSFNEKQIQLNPIFWQMQCRRSWILKYHILFYFFLSLGGEWSPIAFVVKNGKIGAKMSQGKFSKSQIGAPNWSQKLVSGKQQCCQVEKEGNSWLGKKELS